MADPAAMSSSSLSWSFSLPPGCRFYPSEEQLLCYYLHHKNNVGTNNTNSSFSSNPSFYEAIKEIDLYSFNPFELPQVTCFRFGFRGRKRHWYCYTERANEETERRKAGIGFWKRKGKVRDVMGSGGKVIIGKRTRFMFCLDKCNGKRAVRTDWIMYEYALIDNFKASFVVCRVFVKSRRRCSISEHALSSSAEESIANVHHIGIQHDGDFVSANDDDRARGYVNDKTTSMPMQSIEEAKTNNHVASPGHAGAGSSSRLDHLEAILTEDFLELDDLI